MGTRGVYGFRKNSKDKLTYNHYGSYPSSLGLNMLKFISETDLQTLNFIYDKLILVDKDTPITDELKNRYRKYTDLSVGNQTSDSWYCLLRKAQGEPMEFLRGLEHMENSNDFIKDSLFCEWGYIINLDTNMLEIWEGFQQESYINNRYGTIPCTDTSKYTYYPCKLIEQIDLKRIERSYSYAEMCLLKISDD